MAPRSKKEKGGGTPGARADISQQPMQKPVLKQGCPSAAFRAGGCAPKGSAAGAHAGADS